MLVFGEWCPGGRTKVLEIIFWWLDQRFLLSTLHTKIGPFSNSKWVYWSQNQASRGTRIRGLKGSLEIPSIPGWERFGVLLVPHRSQVNHGKPWNCSWNWHRNCFPQVQRWVWMRMIYLGKWVWSSNMLMGFLPHWGFKKTISTSAVSSVFAWIVRTAVTFQDFQEQVFWDFDLRQKEEIWSNLTDTVQLGASTSNKKVIQFALKPVSDFSDPNWGLRHGFD